MSSYLSFYVVPKRKSKEEEKQYIILTAYSRNCDMYQYFNENLNIAYAGNKEDEYTTLTAEDVNLVINDFKKDIDNSFKRLVEYEKYAANNPEYIDEIVELKKYIEELQYWKDKISFIADMISDTGFYSSGIEEVCCNID